MKYTEEQLEILEKANITFKDGRISDVNTFVFSELSAVAGAIIGVIFGALLCFALNWMAATVGRKYQEDKQMLDELRDMNSSLFTQSVFSIVLVVIAFSILFINA